MNIKNSKMSSHICAGDININFEKLNLEWKVSVDDCFRSATGQDLIVYSPEFSNIININYKTIKWQLRMILEDKHNLIVTVFLKSLSEYNIEAFASLTLCYCDDDFVDKKSFRPFKKLFTAGDRLCGLSPLFNISQLILNNKARLNIASKVSQNSFLILRCEITLKKFCDLNENPKSFNRLAEFDEFEKLFMNEESSDFIITADEKIFCAHKCIMMARSDVFKAMFENNMVENNQSKVEINDISSEILYEFLRFIYTGKVYGLELIVCELLYAAEKYSVKGLKTMCEETMCLNLSLDNVIECLELALIHNANKLKTRTIEFIAQYAQDICNNPELKSLGSRYPEVLFEILNATVYKNKS